MKVLVVSTPGAGHINPMLPLVRAFLDAGDEVVVASGAEAGPAVERTGARFAEVGVSHNEVLRRMAERTRGIPGDGLPPERILHYFLPRAFGEVAMSAMIDGAIEVGRSFGPDLVVYEAFALAGPLAADVLGVPGVTHMFGPLPPIETVVLANDAVSPIWREFGRDAPGWGGIYRDLTIQICPPSWEVAEVPVGESLFLRPAPLPTAAHSPGDPPLVYVTFGTVFNDNLDLFRFAVDALAGEPIELVVTVGGNQDPAALGPQPANVRVEQFIPQADLLPRCSTIVHHGGAGTTFGALAHGLPQVILPQGADNYDNAAMCVTAGVAVSLRPEVLDRDSLIAAVRQVLAEPAFAEASARCAAEVAAMPDAAQVAESLRDWVRSR